MTCADGVVGLVTLFYNVGSGHPWCNNDKSTLGCKTNGRRGHQFSFVDNDCPFFEFVCRSATNPNQELAKGVEEIVLKSDKNQKFVQPFKPKKTHCDMYRHSDGIPGQRRLLHPQLSFFFSPLCHFFSLLFLFQYLYHNII